MRWALEYTGIRGEVRVCPRLDDDKLAVYKPGFIRYLYVRVNGLAPIRIMPDEERGTFSGYDEASQIGGLSNALGPPASSVSF